MFSRRKLNSIIEWKTTRTATSNKEKKRKEKKKKIFKFGCAKYKEIIHKMHKKSIIVQYLYKQQWMSFYIQCSSNCMSSLYISNMFNTTNLLSTIKVFSQKHWSGTGNHIYVSIYFEVSDTPTRGHSLWHGQWLCPRQGEHLWGQHWYSLVVTYISTLCNTEV